MTYRELLLQAELKLDHNDITLGEFEQMIAPLNREVDVLDKIKEEILLRDKNVKDVRTDGHCFFTAEEIFEIIDKYMAERSE